MDIQAQSVSLKRPYIYRTNSDTCDSGHAAPDNWVCCIRIGQVTIKICKNCEGRMLNSLVCSWLVRRKNLSDYQIRKKGYAGKLYKNQSLKDAEAHASASAEAI